MNRKPKNLGTELKTVASKDCNGPMIHAEIQEGKLYMRDRPYFRQYGATASCSVRMALATAHYGQRQDTNIRQLFYGDSWFASFKTAEAITEFAMLNSLESLRQHTKDIQRLTWNQR